MAQKLLVLMNPAPESGHVNAQVGIGEQLLRRGHRVHCIINKQWLGKLEQRGFVEELVEPTPDQAEEGDVGQDLAKKVAESFTEDLMVSDVSTLVKKQSAYRHLTSFIDYCQAMDPLIEQVIRRLKPDLIFNDVLPVAAIVKSNVPWIMVMPAQQLSAFEDEDLPPSFSGLPTYDRTHWADFRKQFKPKGDAFKSKILDWFNKEGCSNYKLGNWAESPYFNILSCPAELDYDDVRSSFPDKWLRFDSFSRLEDVEPFAVPEKLKNLPGYLIYFSMGSLGSGNSKLMNRLISLLSKMPYRFIVSMGSFQDSLPDNCWGQKMVPQISVLKAVDLAIVHGGNNTIGEVFAFGTPIIVMPLFTDQYDNAQRIQEKELGVRLDTFNCDEQQLREAIETIGKDKELKQRMLVISKRIQKAIREAEIAVTIENLFKSF